MAARSSSHKPGRFGAFAQRRRHWLLLAMLALLHLAVLQGVGSALGRTLLLMHFGVFLLWQPIVAGQRRLRAVEIVIVVVAALAAAVLANAWFALVWAMLLAAVVGGKVFFSEGRAPRLYYLFALAYLVALLLVLLVPEALPRADLVPEAFDLLARYALPGVLLAMLLIPVGARADAEPEVIDFAYSAFLFLLLAVLVLGALAFMLLTAEPYGAALLKTLAVVSAVLLVLGWSWNPRAGFAGLGALVTRYLFSRSLPIDEWLQRLTDAALAANDPEAFLARACPDFLAVPGVRGGEWIAEGGRGSFGVPGAQSRVYAHGDLELRLNLAQPLGPALDWHLRLLLRLVGEFYAAKRQAQRLQELSYLEAVHETGARLTHDVKNLLQSLNTLCYAAGLEGADDEARFQSMLRKQLPLIAQRLQHTLDKLRHPQDDARQTVVAAAWWAELQRRYAQTPVRFVAGVVADRAQVPGALFTSVAENLIENALAKRHAEPALELRVDFEADAQARLAVTDSGSAVPAALAARLLRAPVASATGLGIGLYQAARQAELAGHRLVLEHNAPGCVRFALVPGEAIRRVAGALSAPAPAPTS